MMDVRAKRWPTPVCAVLKLALVAGLLAVAACDSLNNRDAGKASVYEKRGMLSTQGTRWVDAAGTPVDLRGTNLGNWLLQEFWMMANHGERVNDQCTLEATLDERFGLAERQRLMKLFRDSWITERDWDLMEKFGLNLVRLPFRYNLIEDEHNPYHLRDDAWHYLDHAIEQAEAHGIYVILDLHGAAGSQGWEHHSGCAGRNWYWDGGNGQPASYYQKRTIWLWQQIAQRYKNNSTIAGYGLLNEPWGTSPENLADTMEALYHAVRAVDPAHTIILPGHSEGFEAYGDPARRGMVNVAIDMHPYPGFFGWGEPSLEVHRRWLTCGDGGYHNLCAWRDRLDDIDTAFLVGEFQPWARLGPELGGKIARVSYDTYMDSGWATTSWAYKVLPTRVGRVMASGAW